MQSIVRQTLAHWKASSAPRMGAALSYYAMLSFVPLILLIVSAATMLFSKDIVEHALMHQLVTTIGSNASLYISEILHNAQIQDITIQSAIVSAILCIVGALGVFSELDRDLDELWQVPTSVPKKKVSFFKRINILIHKKIVVLSIIPLLVILLTGTIVMTIFLSIVQTAAVVVPPFDMFITLFQILVPFILSTVLFMLLYRILPNRTLPWKTLFVGALVTAALFIIGNILIAVYIKFLVRTSVFGNASSLVGLLVWIYYSAQVFFLGASFTYIFAQRQGVIPYSDSLQS